LFQDTMVVLFKKVNSKQNFILSAQWSTYIYAIARNLWLKRLKTKKQNIIVLTEITTFLAQISAETDLEFYELQYEEKHNLIKNALPTLKKECRDMINAAFYQKLSCAEIAQSLGYTTNFVKVKKFRCMKALKTKIGLSILKTD
jgi:RNA polymerase sigma factor (sigma-70 family)